MEFYMLVLALDTTTRQGSVALARDGVLLETFAGDGRITHGERLPGDLVRVLDARGLQISDVDLFAVAAGPGSFTGLRIGIAAMQGLALANDKPLVGISALDAIRETLDPSLSPQPVALSPRDEVACWMDAQRGQVFSATFIGRDIAEPALVDKPAEIFERWAREHRQPAVFAGDGALAYRDQIRAQVPAAVVVDPLPPLAPALARLAVAYHAQHGASPPDAVRPIYIRPSDAELTRARQAAS
ncbi:MAG TPA: tRNA (adenosine(37)-N6)-threonylcarbamoyltransferase complex dimerization subunit type 1 TsaB [Vicinamibacterales bacterium]|nr:tRNA (adenosine(37)-N6)-threonylcarbamoyltransferase complex dimerization subunit type 1 TsaB [Vicinamibacterales bacterium]